MRIAPGLPARSASGSSARLHKSHQDAAMIAAALSPSVAGIGRPMRRRLAGFARTLRDNGFKVGLAETRDALAIMTQPMAARASALKPALRSLFCATHSDWERFDQIFEAHWLGRGVRQARIVTGATTE